MDGYPAAKDVLEFDYNCEMLLEKIYDGTTLSTAYTLEEWCLLFFLWVMCLYQLMDLHDHMFIKKKKVRPRNRNTERHSDLTSSRSSQP